MNLAVFPSSLLHDGQMFLVVLMAAACSASPIGEYGGSLGGLGLGGGLSLGHGASSYASISAPVSLGHAPLAYSQPIAVAHAPVYAKAEPIVSTPAKGGSSLLKEDHG